VVAKGRDRKIQGREEQGKKKKIRKTEGH